MSGSRPIHYMQLYNQQHDPVFMELSTGKLIWILPSETLLSNVVYVSHISDEGKFYYEHIDTNKVQWDLPKEKMSLSAVDTAEVVVKASRKLLEKRVGTPYDPSKSNQQMLQLDAYLRKKDALSQQQVQSQSQQQTSGNTFLQAAFNEDNDSDDDERFDSLSAMKSNNNSKKSFVQSGNLSSDDEVDRQTISRNTLSERGSRLSTLKTTDMLKRTALKSGYLMKLATVSGRNWKKRFFTLTPYYLAYYEDESSSTKKPKGELQIVPDGTIQEEKVDKKYGFGFKYTNSVESIVLAASSDIDRAHWIQTLQSLIQQSATHLKAFLTVLPFSTVFQNNNLKNYFGSNNKTPARKYCILTNELLSVHPDKQLTTSVDGLININDETRVEYNESSGNYIINLTDSDMKNSKLSIQFNSGIDDEKFFRLWKNRLNQLIYGGGVGSGNDGTVSTRGSAVSVSATTAAAAAAAVVPVKEKPKPQQQAIPSNVSVFGLSLDDDDEDDEYDDARPAISNVPFKAPSSTMTINREDSYPSAEAKSNASTASVSSNNAANNSTTSKRPSKPIGKSFMKMRAKSQTKDDSTKSPTSPPVTNNPSVSSSVFGVNLDDDDDDQEVYQPAFSAQNSSSSVRAASPVPPPPPPPPQKKVEVIEVDPTESFNPVAASRRRSVTQPLPPTASNTPSGSLFLQSLKAKSEASGLSGTNDEYQNPINGGNNKPPPPPPFKKNEISSQNYEDPNSLHDFTPPDSNATTNTPFAQENNIFNPRRKSLLTPFTESPPVINEEYNRPSSNNSLSTFNVNALEYNNIELQPGEYDDTVYNPQPMRSVPVRRSSRNSIRQSFTNNNGEGPLPITARSISDLSLQEYLTTPIELRTSKQLDEIFAKPTEEFLIQTNQILFQCKDKLKQLLSENHQLIPLLQKNKSIVQETKKSSFSLAKIEEYLQSHSIFSGKGVAAGPFGNNSSGGGNNPATTSSYQQLLQEKEVILNLLQFMKLSEENMIQTIQLYETEALERIQTEGNFYRQELTMIEQEIKKLHTQHFQQINEHTKVIESSKSLLKEKYEQFQDTYQENIQQLLSLTKDLQGQQQQIQIDRKKMLKQRYQLDILLQEINDVQQFQNHGNNVIANLPFQGISPTGMNYNQTHFFPSHNSSSASLLPSSVVVGGGGFPIGYPGGSNNGTNYSQDGYQYPINQNHPAAVNGSGLQYNNYPPSNGFSNQQITFQTPSFDGNNSIRSLSNPNLRQQQQQFAINQPQQLQLQQQQQQQYLGNNQSQMIMQELQNSSTGYPVHSPNSNFSGSGIRGGGGNGNAPNFPSRSVSPNGNRLMVGGNMTTAAQAAALHYNNNRSLSPLGGAGNSLSNVFPNSDMNPPLPEDGNGLPYYSVDEVNDYRGRSRVVQPNNINANTTARGRSRSPAGSQSGTIQSAPVRIGATNLTKQHLQQHQLQQQQQPPPQFQQQQQQPQQMIGGTSSNGTNSRGASPSPYYMGPNNIQVNLEQLKKHTRKPFK